MTEEQIPSTSCVAARRPHSQPSASSHFSRKRVICFHGPPSPTQSPCLTAVAERPPLRCGQEICCLQSRTDQVSPEKATGEYFGQPALKKNLTPSPCGFLDSGPDSDLPNPSPSCRLTPGDQLGFYSAPFHNVSTTEWINKVKRISL